jgi:hypothetical protein
LCAAAGNVTAMAGLIAFFVIAVAGVTSIAHLVTVALRDGRAARVTG